MESRKIARVPQLGQMTKRESDHARKLQMECSREDQKICARAKYLTVTKSREIARVPQLGQMTKIESNRVRKLQSVRSREDRKICARAHARHKFDDYRIVRNHTGNTIRPNDDDGM